MDIIVKAGEESTIHTGGLIGYAKKAQIDNAQIGGTKEDGTAIKGINIENNTPKGLIGGICAVASDESASASSTDAEIKITNSNISNSEMTGKNHIGGGIGFSTIAEVEGLTVNKTNLTTEGDGIVGGIAGVITNTTSELAGTSQRSSKITIKTSKLTDVVKAGLNYVSELLGLGIAE